MNHGDLIYPGGAFEGDDDSAAVMGQITVSMYAVRFEADGIMMDLPAQGLELWLDESGDRVLFSHPTFPGWTIYSLDPAILDHRSFQQQALKNRVAELRLEKSGTPKHTVLVYSVLGGIIAALIGLWAFKGLIIGAIVAIMPASWETQIGEAAYKEMRDELTIMSDPVYTNRLHLVMQRLKKGMPSEAPKFTYLVADDPEVNAMALPGGQVIVNRGLMDEATPDELAGVLSHEIAHVLEKHGMQQLAQVIGPFLVVEYFFNNDGALAGLIAAAASLSTLEYSRANETEADEKGWEIMFKANIDPRAQISFLEKLRKIDPLGDIDFFSTHPATSDRIKRLEQLWEEAPKKSGFQKVSGGPDPKR